MKNKKMMLVIIGIIIVVIVAVVLILILKNDTQPIKENSIDVEQLEIDFDSLFDNQGNEYVKTLYHLEEEKSVNYLINADIPYIHTGQEIDNKINKEINDIFSNKILQIVTENKEYTKIDIDYSTIINEDILSMAIKCVLKEGNRAQRTIIKTYNYDIKNQQEVRILDIIPEGKKGIIQTQINSEIEKQIKKEETILTQGYNTYRRDKDSDIYILENATEFYIKDSVLYIIYSYGNNNYTSEMDLIINKI